MIQDGATAVVVSGRRKGLRRALDAAYRASGALAALCLASIAAVMLLQALLRNGGILLPAADEITAWLCGATVFLALASTYRQGEFIRMALLIERLPHRLRQVCEAACLVTAAAFAGYWAFWTAVTVTEHIEFGDRAHGLLAIPIWIPKLAMLAGTAALFVAVLDDLVMLLCGGRPSYEAAAGARRADGVPDHV
jgi:TRAP-type C4-dicarboxylate transport system permease small subunit